MDAPRYVLKMLEEVECNARITSNVSNPATAWGFTVAVKGNSGMLKKLEGMGWTRGAGYLVRTCQCSRMYCACGAKVKHVKMYYYKGANPTKEAEYGE